VLLVEDHASFRQSLAFMLGREPDIAVVGQAGSLAEARRLLADADVVVLDLGLPDGDGSVLIGEVRVVNPHAAVLVLTASANQLDLARAVEAGAAGTLNKAVMIDEIVDAVRRLSAGETLFSPRELLELLRLADERREQAREAQGALGRLTPREREVLQALAEGLTDKDMARRLHVSVETIRTHMVRILAKLGVDSRLQAVVFAAQHGAVKLG
jgi:DNA-binding NarL/FixJ family response regulator